MDNLAERLQRYISLSRKNPLFCGSHAGAERTALIYSLACSCRLNGINTFEYFADVLNRLAYISLNAPVGGKGSRQGVGRGQAYHCQSFVAAPL